MATIPLDKQTLVACSVGGILASISLPSCEIQFTQHTRGANKTVKAEIEAHLENIVAFTWSEDGLFLAVCCGDQIYIIDSSEVIQAFRTRDVAEEELLLPYTHLLFSSHPLDTIHSR